MDKTLAFKFASTEVGSVSVAVDDVDCDTEGIDVPEDDDDADSGFIPVVDAHDALSLTGGTAVGSLFTV
jgi:hypothetical protein